MRVARWNCWLDARVCIVLLGLLHACYHAKASDVSVVRNILADTESGMPTLESFRLPEINVFESRKPSVEEAGAARTSAENFAHGFRDHQLVVPIRLHHVTGHPVHHGRHFRKRRKEDDRTKRKRSRRDLEQNRDSTFYLHQPELREQAVTSRAGVTNKTYLDEIPGQFSGDDDDYIDEDETQLDHRFANFSITAFGEDFRLHLTPYDEFLAPNYTLHYMGDAHKEGFKGADLDVPRHCFYSGYVNGRSEHRAVLSVCRGLFGAFRVGASDYLIQPEEDPSSHPDQHEADEEGTKPHRIFKRSSHSSGSQGRQLCGFTGTDSRHQERPASGTSSTATESLALDDDVIHRLRKMGTSASSHNRNSAEHRRRLQVIRRLRDRNASRLRHHLVAMVTRMNASEAYLKRALTRLGIASSSAASSDHRSRSAVTSSDKDVTSSDKDASSDKDVTDDDTTHSRKKRYLSYARNVEVMVTADNAMVKTHDDVEHYVLTLMAIVNHVYHDPSIENLINIVLVKLVVVGDSQVHNGPEVERNAHACLRNFCDWQSRQNDLDDSHPNHHDTAVLITGTDICRTNAACDTLGLAELGTMCDSKRSCSINEDNGLSTAFTISHEIGHEFGMVHDADPGCDATCHRFNAPHDTNDKCVDARGRPVGLNVMSPTLDHNAHPWSWSKCSAKYITSFLDNGNGKCLLDEPPQRVLPLPIEEPGEVFDANEQCSFVYGKGVKHCNFMFQHTCARLWCVSQNISHGCRTPHVPWADGTRCGDRSKRMWCQQGKCVPEDRHRVPVDGSWGEWSRFGDCSRSCGGGIKSATRTCDNPKPQYGGRYCTGKRKKFRPCNHQECSEERDFRAEQCAAYNSWSRLHKHRIRGLAPNAEWIPKYDGILLQDRCKLICQVRSTNQYAVPWYVLKPKVINGTPCGPDTHDICVEGVCKRAGCDHVMGSRATEDECGVCNGDNTGCRTVQGSYNAGYNFGYNQVVIIPAGANNIIITQTSYTSTADDYNYLALKDAHGNYILNGNRSVMKTKHRVHKRSRSQMRNYEYFCDYSGTDNVVEMINCSKAIHADIIVEVLSAGELMPPNINYRYNFPNPDRLSYRWDPNGPWSTCSRPCNGKTKAKISCVRSDQQVVADKKCQHLPKPNSIIRPCNTKCQLSWHPKPSECLVRCGTGTTRLNFECRKVTVVTDDGDRTNHPEVEIVSDDMCSQPKPGGVRACRGDCLPTNWIYSEWGECSTTCGDGSQTRTAICKDTNGRELDADQCVQSQRVLTRPCSDGRCPTWVTSSFSTCMVTCGTGIRQRRVWCSAEGSVRGDNECSRRDRPSTTAICRERLCTTWKYGGWSSCSVTCGPGTSTRLYQCVDPSGRTVDEGNCDESLLRHQTRSCNAARRCYTAISRTYGGGQYPSMVGRGLAGRGVTSPSTVATTVSTTTTTAPTTTTTTTTLSTTTTTRPYVLRSGLHQDDGGVLLINRRREMAQWRTGSWTSCSRTCGPGFRERYVSCRHNRGSAEADDAMCGPPESRPASREACQVQACHGEWRTGAWSDCSETCGSGTRTRHVRCAYAGRYHDDDTHCQHAPRPNADETCHVAPCPTTTTVATTTTTSTTTRATTTTSTTTESTTTTQEPVIHDVIHPRNSHDAIDDSSSLVIKGRLEDGEVGKAKHETGMWRTGRWSRCSKSCGLGRQNRAVVCRSSSGQPAHCDSASRPTEVKTCDSGSCARWRHSRWSKCSRSCHGGTRTRTVYCMTSHNQRLYDHHCDVTKRPTQIDACNLKSCPAEHRWRKSAWSACSKSCGRGFKSRTVACVDTDDSSVPDAMCLSGRQAKPLAVRRCRQQKKCPRWRTGRWGKCSTTCGAGVKRRLVRCRYKRKNILDSLCDQSTKPLGFSNCNVTTCSTYRWNAGQWRSCSKSCGTGVMTRSITCQRTSDNLKVAASFCQSVPDNSRLQSSQQCNTGPCSALWDTGAWSECTRSCGSGMQRRAVTCSYIDPITYKVKETSTCDNASRPYGVRDCNLGSCRSHLYWRVGPWGQCSVSCGHGVSMRRVACTDHRTQAPLDDVVCQAMPSFRPERTRRCQVTPCIPTSCRELQVQLRVTTDGDYNLKIKDKLTKIYCKNMATSRPLEYVSLTSGDEENYSEIYGYRLINADTCPSNGSRDNSCACHHDNPDAGKTSFRKVRLDVRNLRIQINDFSFATTSYGKAVPFGVAGDCYSRANCPQGVFRINLEGTGFVVDPGIRWRSYGAQSVRRTHKSHSGDIVYGTCGGYCSRCQPDPSTGLLLTHDT